MKEKFHKLASSTKQISESPYYLLKYDYEICRIEILINDKLLIKKNNELDHTLGYIPINHLLVPNKTQNISLKIKSLKNRSINEHSNFTIEIVEFSSKQDYLEKRFDNVNQLLQYNLRKDSISSIIGKKTFTKKIPFTVMKELKPVNLPRKKLDVIPQEKLSKSLSNFYDKIRNSLNNKEEDTFLEFWYNKTKMTIQSNLYTPNEVDNLFNEAKNIYKQAHFPALENYKMVFYDQGRLVCLESISEDPKLKEQSPLIATAIASDGSKYEIPIQFYFYIPKGSTELKILY